MMHRTLTDGSTCMHCGEGSSFCECPDGWAPADMDTQPPVDPDIVATVRVPEQSIVVFVDENKKPLCACSTDFLMKQLQRSTPQELEVSQLRIKLRAADAMARVADDWVERGIINSRSALADARLDYGDPYTYEYSDR